MTTIDFECWGIYGRTDVTCSLGDIDIYGECETTKVEKCIKTLNAENSEFWHLERYPDVLHIYTRGSKWSLLNAYFNALCDDEISQICNKVMDK